MNRLASTLRASSSPAVIPSFASRTLLTPSSPASSPSLSAAFAPPLPTLRPSARRALSSPLSSRRPLAPLSPHPRATPPPAMTAPSLDRSAPAASNGNGNGSANSLSTDAVSTAPPPIASMPAYRGEILCNRALNMAKIRAIGFDMDYTLALYHSERFEHLAASSALQKLVHQLGYPKPLLNLRYDHSQFIRGLVIDKECGNILKLDRHKYVKRALHGRIHLSKEQRSEMYDAITQSGGGFAEPRFSVLDAMFALPDAFLFSNVVAYKDDHAGEIAQDYNTIYKDVRRSVDMCHRDGSIKEVVKKDPQTFIQKDDGLVPMLRKLKRSGRKVFVLTNSLWDYTDAVMQYLCEGDPTVSSWIDLFDIIITGSAKPAFILDKRLPLYRVNPTTGLLENTDGVLYNETPTEYLAQGKCFQGGNYTHLQELLDGTGGTQVLYVGDHIFSDVLRSKRTLGWRTMLIVPELEGEVNMLYEPMSVALAEEIQILGDARDELDEWVDRLEGKLMRCSPPCDADADADTDAESKTRAGVREREAVEHELDSARVALEQVRVKIADKIERYHKRFHPIWGQLFKTGLQNSRFAEQVECYACLYTSSVSNIGLVSPDINWRAMPDLMPHDRLTVAPMHHMLTKRAVVSGVSDG